MNWIFYAAVAALALAAADVLIKQVAGKIPDSLGMLLYGMVPFLSGLVWYLSERTRRPVTANIPPGTLFLAVSVGIAFSIVTGCMYAAFRHGAPISLASPLIRLGGLVVASVAGILLWHELFNIRYAGGLLLVSAGLYLILTR